MQGNEQIYGRPRESAGRDGNGTLLKVIALLCAGIFVVVLVSALLMVPRVIGAARSVETVLGELGVSLASGDAAATLKDLSELLRESRDGVALAAEKIEALDVEAFNSAIESLSKIISPLSKLFGG